MGYIGTIGDFQFKGPNIQVTLMPEKKDLVRVGNHNEMMNLAGPYLNDRSSSCFKPGMLVPPICWTGKGCVFDIL